MTDLSDLSLLEIKLLQRVVQPTGDGVTVRKKAGGDCNGRGAHRGARRLPRGPLETRATPLVPYGQSAATRIALCSSGQDAAASCAGFETPALQEEHRRGWEQISSVAWLAASVTR